MGNEEKLIWEYLDGTLSQLQKSTFEQRLTTDPTFLALYNQQKKVHEGLQTMQADEAPEHILSNVMVSLRNVSIYQPKTTKFSAIKYFSYFFVALNILLIGWGLTTSPSGGSSSLFGEKLDFIPEAFAGFNVPVLPTIDAQFLLYGVALGLLVVLFWGDFIMNRVRMARSSKSN